MSNNSDKKTIVAAARSSDFPTPKHTHNSDIIRCHPHAGVLPRTAFSLRLTFFPFFSFFFRLLRCCGVFFFLKPNTALGMVFVGR